MEGYVTQDKILLSLLQLQLPLKSMEVKYVQLRTESLPQWQNLCSTPSITNVTSQPGYTDNGMKSAKLHADALLPSVMWNDWP